MMTRAALRPMLVPRADLIGVLEALYSPEPDGRTWGARVVAALGEILTEDVGFGFNVVAHQADYAHPEIIFDAVSRAFEGSKRAVSHNAVEALPPAVFKALYYAGGPVLKQTDLDATLPGDDPMLVKAYRDRVGWRDCLGLFAYPEPGIASVMFLGMARCDVQPEAMSSLVRLAGHYDSALRLRTQPDHMVGAVLKPDGTFADLADPSLEKARRGWFGHHIAAIETSRTKKRGRVDLEPWWALLDGRYSVVPIEDSDGKRYYLLVNNPPVVERHARLTQHEIDVVRMAARGFTSKSVAYNLGLSSGSVSQALGSATKKLGLRSRHDLLRVGAAMFGVPSKSVELKTLTRAERDVLELLRRGLSNEQIAVLRKRSLNTVKNQLASLLRKTGSPSRRALALSTGAQTS